MKQEGRRGVDCPVGASDGNGIEDVIEDLAKLKWLAKSRSPSHLAESRTRSNIAIPYLSLVCVMQSHPCLGLKDYQVSPVTAVAPKDARTSSPLVALSKPLTSLRGAPFWSAPTFTRTPMPLPRMSAVAGTLKLPAFTS